MSFIKNILQTYRYFLQFFLVLGLITSSHADTPITTDSRIKTFIYNENEVFRLDFQHGYQSSIEFGLKEHFETISVGNSNSWKITPVGRRIFIKPLDGDSKTNMTVITNKYVYHFDLQSHYPGKYLDNNLIYVARFYHPSKSVSNLNNSAKESVSTVQYSEPYVPVPPAIEPAFTDKTIDLGSNNFAEPANFNQQVKTKNLNYNYMLTGSEELSPVKIFDDGNKTFFMFLNYDPNSKIYALILNQKMPVTPYKVDNYIAVDKIADQFIIESGSNVVNIYKQK